MSESERPPPKPEQPENAPPKLGAFPRIGAVEQVEVEPVAEPPPQPIAQPEADPHVPAPSAAAANAVGATPVAAVDGAEAQSVVGTSPEKSGGETAEAEAKADSPRALLGAKSAFPLAFLSGFLYFVAFPGIDVWPLAFLALVPLIVALRGQRPRRAAALGWVAGVALTRLGF